MKGKSMLTTPECADATRAADVPRTGDPHSDFLCQYDEHIRAAARKAIPRRLFSQEVLDLEIDDLTQAVRIKLWQMLQKKHAILNPKTYIYYMARSGAIDMVRRHKQIVALSLDEYGELVQDMLFITMKASQEVQDPACVLEEWETLHEYISKASELIVQLPLQQRLALICALKERLEDVRPLGRALWEKGIDIEVVNWPEGEVEQHRLKASVSQARKKLRCSLGELVAQS